ncbi:MAG: hypothetical protein L3J84_12460 [Gammaproteobacteria bacterium]|nr:hypothetical protein [Gammaproteobacteria bacterium]
MNVLPEGLSGNVLRLLPYRLKKKVVETLLSKLVGKTRKFIHNVCFLANLLSQFSVLLRKLPTFCSLPLLLVFSVQPLILLGIYLAAIVLIPLVVVAFTLYPVISFVKVFHQ